MEFYKKYYFDFVSLTTQNQPTMKQLLKILLTLLITNYSFLIVNGQNLVPNPSFEDTAYCPTTLADLSATIFWTAPTIGSPDYFNVCNSGDANVPNNIFGTQSALSGNAYIGISVYDTQDVYSYREYVQIQLQQQLNSGQEYFMVFYVSLADFNDYGIQELGAYFSASQTNNTTMDTTLSFTPQIEFNDGFITDKINWTKISGSFIATGNENYLLIGNFNRKQSTSATQVSTTNVNYAYYFIDNICVSTDSSYCANYIYTGLQEESLKDNFNIYPNPVADYFTINYDLLNEPYDLFIYNTLGQKLYEEKNITGKSKTIDATPFNKGILFLNVKSKNQSINYKLFKQ